MADDLNLDLSFEVEDELDETENSSSSSDEDKGDLGDVPEDELEMEVEPVPVAAAPYQHEPEPRQLEVDGKVDAVPRARRNEDFTRLDPNNTANNTCSVVVYITSASARYRGTPCMLYCEPVDELGRCTCVQFQVSGALGQG